VTPLGVIICCSMIYGLGWTNWLRLGVWLVIGLVIYFSYSRRHSKVQLMLSGAPAPKGEPSMAD
jgi:basic amino acid/polyamine antiporter, APA family